MLVGVIAATHLDVARHGVAVAALVVRARALDRHRCERHQSDRKHNQFEKGRRTALDAIHEGHATSSTATYDLSAAHDLMVGAVNIADCFRRPTPLCTWALVRIPVAGAGRAAVFSLRASHTSAATRYQTSKAVAVVVGLQKLPHARLLALVEHAARRTLVDDAAFADESDPRMSDRISRRPKKAPYNR